MSPLGNLIFTPLLTLFLWGSSLFSFFTLLQLPYHWITCFLDYVTISWNYILSFSQPTWLIGLSHSMLLPSITIALGIIVFYTLYNPNKKQAFIFLGSCFVILFLCKQSITKKSFYQIGNLPLYTLHINNKTYLLDNGALCSKQNFYSWIDYTILPELIKTAGITTIDTLILYKPSKRLAKITRQFAEQTNVKNILVTTKQKCFYEVKNLFQENKINIYPIIFGKNITNKI